LRECLVQSILSAGRTLRIRNGDERRIDGRRQNRKPELLMLRRYQSSGPPATDDDGRRVDAVHQHTFAISNNAVQIEIVGACRVGPDTRQHGVDLG